MSQPARRPRVSILMPVYNAEAYVAQAIRSVLAQRVQDIELIVIDDGSTDGSAAIVVRTLLGATIPTHVERQANAGPSPALHKALGLATGEWLCWLAADDAYPPDFLERNLAAAAAIGREDLVLHSNAWLIEADGKVTGVLDDIATQQPFEGECFDLIVGGGGRMLPSTMFTRTALLRRAGGFDPTIRVEDTDLFLRLGRVAWFHYLDQPNFYSRWTPGSLGKQPWAWGDDVIKALSKHADRLGDRLPHLLGEVSLNIAQNCVAYGRWGDGLKWGGRAVGYAPTGNAKLGTVARLLTRVPPAMIRSLLLSSVGRERLVRWKRRLARP